jgi:hypothetical protein
VGRRSGGCSAPDTVAEAIAEAITISIPIPETIHVPQPMNIVEVA